MNPLVAGDTLAHEGAVFAILAIVLISVALLILLLRTRALPTCWNCGHMSVRRAHSRRVLDYFARVALLYPYPCEKCLRRFYCFKSGYARGAARAASAGRS